VAGIAISKEWDRIESPWYNLFNEIAMQPFSRAEAVDLLVEPVRGYYLYEPAAIAFIVDQCDGRPFRLQQYALEAVNHMLKGKRRRILLEDAEFAHQQILATMLVDHSRNEPVANAVVVRETLEAGEAAQPPALLPELRPKPQAGLGPAQMAGGLR
jgi:hypothetical protein